MLVLRSGAAGSDFLLPLGAGVRQHFFVAEGPPTAFEQDKILSDDGGIVLAGQQKRGAHEGFDMVILKTEEDGWMPLDN